MITRCFGTALMACALLPGSAAAQAPQTAPTTAAASPTPAATISAEQTDLLKQRMRVFEQLLLQSLETGESRFAQWARSLAPVELEPSRVLVTSIFLPDTGSLVFVVTPPSIRPVSVNLWLLARPQADPVSPTQRVNAAGLVPADPMLGPTPASTTVAPSAACGLVSGTDPNQVLSECVREALYNAMLDGGVVLPIASEQSVTLQMDSSDNPNPLYRTGRKLILNLKGEYLIQLKSGKITREEAKKHITETRF